MNHLCASFTYLLNLRVTAQHTRAHTHTQAHVSPLSPAPPGAREGDPLVNKKHSLREEATDRQTGLLFYCLTSTGAGRTLVSLPVLVGVGRVSSGQVRTSERRYC